MARSGSASIDHPREGVAMCNTTCQEIAHLQSDVRTEILSHWAITADVRTELNAALHHLNAAHRIAHLGCL